MDGLSVLHKVGSHLTELACVGREPQVAGRVDLDRARPAEGHSDRVRVGPGREHPIVFQALRIPVEDQVDPGIDTAIAHASILRHVATPFGRLANKVIRCSPQDIQRFKLRGFEPPIEVEFHPRGLGCPANFEYYSRR